MKETDINQLISAYYDDELTDSELDYLLEETKKDPQLLARINNYALISTISEKDDRVTSIFENISDFVQREMGWKRSHCSSSSSSHCYVYK